jgi:transcriptional regulator with PAS, ATPase and Fis domain
VPLALEFVRRNAQGRSIVLDARLAEALRLCDWPLNVRELALLWLVRQLVDLHGSEGVLSHSHLPERIASCLCKTRTSKLRAYRLLSAHPEFSIEELKTRR